MEQKHFFKIGARNGKTKSRCACLYAGCEAFLIKENVAMSANATKSCYQLAMLSMTIFTQWVMNRVGRFFWKEEENIQKLNGNSLVFKDFLR